MVALFVSLGQPPVPSRPHLMKRLDGFLQGGVPCGYQVLDGRFHHLVRQDADPMELASVGTEHLQPGELDQNVARKLRRCGAGSPSSFRRMGGG